MTPETTKLLIWLIPLPPLLAFFLIVLLTNRNKALSHTIGVGAAALSFLTSMAVFIAAVGAEHLGEHPFKSSIPWLPTGEEWFRIGVLIDPLGAAVLFFVSITILMIFLYSVGYQNYGQPAGDHDRAGLPPHGATVEEHGHKHVVPSIEPMYSRFFAFLGLFAFGMYTLVVSDNLLTMFAGWEVMGLCSYLLIGFWYGKESRRNAAIKAFMTTRIGDVFMLLGIAFLYSATGTLSFREIFQEEVLHVLATTATPILGLSAAGLIGLLLFIGTIGKSAQWPLHVWLPDAMEGPTPVSAMIHAATMVSAGVYAAIRMFPLLSLDPGTMSVVAFIGTFTAIFAATIAVAQNDINRVLAYSTISQLGFMIAALGIGAYVAAAFHLITHAFFKALLFLGSGSVIHGMEHGVLHTGNHKVDPQDMFNMGGLRKKMPITFWTFLIGGFALSGFPIITAGFWSKDEILADAFGHGHMLVFITLAIAAFMTAFYTMRQITLTFLGEPRTKEAEHAQETPWTMTVPLIVLAVFAVIYGWVGIPEHFPVIGGILPNWFHGFVGSTLAEEPEAVAFSPWPLVTSLFVALVGLAAGYLVYRNVKTPAEDKLQIPVLKNKWYFDEAYNFLFVKPAYWFAETFVYKWMDQTVIDGFLHTFGKVTDWLGDKIRTYIDLKFINETLGDGTGNIVKWTGINLRPMQTGRVQQYMLTALLTIIVVGVVLAYFLSAVQESNMNIPILSLILFLPAAAALVIFFLPKDEVKLIRWTALLMSLIPLALTVYLWLGFDPNAIGYQFEEKYTWYEAIGSSLHLGVDGLSLAMVLLTTFLTPLALLASFSITDRVKAYMILFLFLETGMLGVFMAIDLLVFFVFWEIGLVPMYFLINQWGSANRNYASLKFMIYTMGGSLGLLLGIQLLGVLFKTFELQTIIQLWNAIPSTEQFGATAITIGQVKTVAFWAFVIAFAIKVPVWPFHTWLPDAHTEAPTAGSMILAGVLLKLGAYGFLRLVLPLYPEQAQTFAGALAFLAVAAIVFGAFAAYGQTDFKRLVAYSSINHMGFVLLGIAAAAKAAGTLNATIALNGAVLQMFNHGLSAAGMFFLVGVIYERTHTRNLNDFGGLFPLVPVYGGILIFTSMASLGLPGLNGFISEFLVVRGSWPILPVFTAVAMLGLLFTGAYILKGIKNVLHGPLNEHWAHGEHKLTEINIREIIVMAPLMVLILVIGVWPGWILDVINKAMMMLY